MSYLARLRVGQAATATKGIAVAIAGTSDGSWLDLSKVQPGTKLHALVTTVVKTSSAVMTPSVQVSDDQSTVYTLKTGTATAAGTGSTVTTNQIIETDAIPWKFARVRITVSGASTVAADDTIAISWRYLKDPIGG